MMFDSIVFLFIFFPVSLLIYYLTPGRFKNVVLVFLSLIFYAWGEPVHLCVLLGIILWNYAGGMFVARVAGRKKRKKMLAAVVGVDVLIFVLFKYAGTVFEYAGSPYADNRFLLVPIGISFFMLQSISYIADIYRGEAHPQKSIIKYALLICLFPKVVAGPLVQTGDFERQIARRKLSWGRFSDGMMLFVRGMTEKVILGNACREVFEAVQQFPASKMSVLSAWTGCGAFALWMYFSFGGYCNMAAGLGKVFGFEFPENVNYPCMATGIMDFWSRWQITVWKWFCSYVYLPLCKGNPAGAAGFFSLLVTWTVIGLWHGAEVTFVVWGIYFAVLLYMEGFVLRPVLKKFPRPVLWLGTMVFVMIGWVFFFSDSISGAFSYLGYMFGSGGSGLIDAKAVSLLTSHGVLLAVSLLAAVPVTARVYGRLAKGEKRWQVIFNGMAYTLLFLLCLAGIVSRSAAISEAFYYFRF